MSLQDNMASHVDDVNDPDLTEEDLDLTEDEQDEALPPPPQNSELFARLNAGANNGRVIHDVWVPISSHTAKCDLCLEHNTTVCQRCQNCNRQLCRKCIHTANGDGIHAIRANSLNWIPAPPVRRGPRGPSLSASPLNITGSRTASSPARRSRNPLLRPSPLRIQTGAQVAQSIHSPRTPDMNINRSLDSPAGKRGRSDDGDPFTNSDRDNSSPNTALKKLKIDLDPPSPSLSKHVNPPRMVTLNVISRNGDPASTLLLEAESLPTEATPPTIPEFPQTYTWYPINRDPAVNLLPEAESQPTGATSSIPKRVDPPKMVNWNATLHNEGPAFTLLPEAKTLPTEATPKKSKRVNIKLNTGSSLSTQITSQSASESSITDNKLKPSIPGARKRSNNNIQKKPTTGSATMSNNKKDIKNMEDSVPATIEAECTQKEKPSPQAIIAFGSGTATDELPPTPISPKDKDTGGDETFKKLKAEQEKMEARENNEILLDLQSKGKHEEAEEMLDAAMTLIEMSRGG